MSKVDPTPEAPTQEQIDKAVSRVRELAAKPRRKSEMSTEQLKVLVHYIDTLRREVSDVSWRQENARRY